MLEQIPFLQNCEDEDSDEDDELDSVQHKKQRVKVRARARGPLSRRAPLHAEGLWGCFRAPLRPGPSLPHVPISCPAVLWPLVPSKAPWSFLSGQPFLQLYPHHSLHIPSLGSDVSKWPFLNHQARPAPRYPLMARSPSRQPNHSGTWKCSDAPPAVSCSRL